jgi:5'(3')-deoxyribonucleotidase
MKKRILGIDVDGTIVDTMEKWLDFYKNEFNSEASKEDLFIYNVSRIFPFVDYDKMREYFERAFENIDDLKLLISKDNIRELNSLSKKFDIYIITSTFSNINQVKKLLDVNNIKYKSFIFVKDSDEKYKYCDILIDDKAKTIKSVVMHNKIGILYLQNWSKSELDEKIISTYTCKNWNEILSVLKKI